MSSYIRNAAMKSFFTALLGCSLILLFADVRFAAAQGTSFTGEITDEHLNCVQNPMKAPDGIKQKDACVLYWAHFAQPPSKYVLYDAATKTTYQLDDQNLAQPYAGAKVKVTGTLDSATKTIKVSDIKVPPTQSKTS